MSQELVPYSDIEKMGNAVAKSGLFGVKTPDQAIALMLVAQALGKHPALAAMEYNIIQGRPAKKADAMLSDFQASGGTVKWITLTDEKAEATFTHPQGGSVTLDWTIDRAKKANLYDKDGSMYKKYPRSMLRARLVADGVRAVYPAATGGVRAVEEFDDADTVSDVQVDRKKSRLDNIVDAEHTPAPAEPKEIEAPKAAPVADKPKAAKDKNKAAAPGVKTVTGVIEEIPKIAEVVNPATGKSGVKHSFKIGDKFYGTFDIPLANGIMKVVDLQNAARQKGEEMKILVKFGFTERFNADKTKTFQDIVSFEEITIDEIPIDEVE